MYMSKTLYGDIERSRNIYEITLIFVAFLFSHIHSSFYFSSFFLWSVIACVKKRIGSLVSWVFFLFRLLSDDSHDLE